MINFPLLTGLGLCHALPRPEFVLAVQTSTSCKSKMEERLASNEAFLKVIFENVLEGGSTEMEFFDGNYQ